jgi:Pyruvate/2-oxoacid:ferredoxin oxidoreductase delta subunit
MRDVLGLVWKNRQLDMILIPTWQEDSLLPKPALLTSHEELKDADPFAPIMRENAAKAAVTAIENNPEGSLGFVLRPCELVSLRVLAHQRDLKLGNTLVMGTDCLATFPEEDFKWRLENAQDREQLSREALHFAAQGGILPSRYRSSCQICEQPYPTHADVNFEFLGVETRDHFIIEVRDADLINDLGFDEISQEDIPPGIIARRERTLERIVDWRQQSLDYAFAHLSEAQKSIQGFVDHLQGCSPCRNNIAKLCPLFDVAWLSHQKSEQRAMLEKWLRSCSGCGMCSYTCPESYPLFNTVTFLSHRLRGKVH